MITGLGTLGGSQEDLPINACVVWDIKSHDYFVFLTTDTEKTAQQIIQTYELRPEIEEELKIEGEKIGDQKLIEELTKDGSSTSDWAKMESNDSYDNGCRTGKINH